MNAYSFIFRSIIEGEEAGVKAKKSLPPEEILLVGAGSCWAMAGAAGFLMLSWLVVLG